MSILLVGNAPETVSLGAALVRAGVASVTHCNDIEQVRRTLGAVAGSFHWVFLEGIDNPAENSRLTHEIHELCIGAPTSLLGHRVRADSQWARAEHLPDGITDDPPRSRLSRCTTPEAFLTDGTDRAREKLGFGGDAFVFQYHSPCKRD